jgi:hypothetical protein
MNLQNRKGWDIFWLTEDLSIVWRRNVLHGVSCYRLQSFKNFCLIQFTTFIDNGSMLYSICVHHLFVRHQIVIFSFCNQSIKRAIKWYEGLYTRPPLFQIVSMSLLEQTASPLFSTLFYKSSTLRPCHLKVNRTDLLRILFYSSCAQHFCSVHCPTTRHRTAPFLCTRYQLS